MNVILDHFADRTKGTMIDVGAHVGGSLLPFLYLGWNVYAFEPDASNRQKLEHAGRFEKLVVHDWAVSDYDAQDVPFFSSVESTGISSLSSFRETHIESGRVTIVSLRTFLAKNPNIDQVDFLKIDAEGHDLMVLKGFPFDRMKPEVILCEFEDNKTVPLGYTHRDMADFLIKQGYNVYCSEWDPITQYGVEHAWRSLRRWPCELADKNGWGNFIAIRNDKTCKLPGVE